jgi:Isochorismatase family
MAPMALLIMDVQQGIVERFASDDGYLDRLARATAAARGAGVAVIYVTVAFRPGYPEVSERNKSFSAIAGTGRFTDGDPGMQIPAAIAPAPGEVTVTKRRVSAFAGSDLEVVLRARGISHLVLAGIATSGWCCPPAPGRRPGLPAHRPGRWLPGCRSRRTPNPAGHGIPAAGGGHHDRRLGLPPARRAAGRR